MELHEWVENRILWKVSRFGLPGPHTYRFTELPIEHRERLECGAHTHQLGRPVLAFVASAEQWTLLGTLGVLSRYDGLYQAFRLRDLVGGYPVDTRG